MWLPTLLECTFLIAVTFGEPGAFQSHMRTCRPRPDASGPITTWRASRLGTSLSTLVMVLWRLSVLRGGVTRYSAGSAGPVHTFSACAVDSLPSLTGLALTHPSSYTRSVTHSGLQCHFCDPPRCQRRRNDPQASSGLHARIRASCNSRSSSTDCNTDLTESVSLGCGKRYALDEPSTDGPPWPFGYGLSGLVTRPQLSRGVSLVVLDRNDTDPRPVARYRHSRIVQRVFDSAMRFAGDPVVEIR
jgi:hypothetical protein